MTFTILCAKRCWRNFHSKSQSFPDVVYRTFLCQVFKLLSLMFIYLPLIQFPFLWSFVISDPFAFEVSEIKSFYFSRARPTGKKWQNILVPSYLTVMKFAMDICFQCTSYSSWFSLVSQRNWKLVFTFRLAKTSFSLRH